MEELCLESLRTATRSINVPCAQQRPKFILTVQESRRTASHINPLKQSSLYVPPGLTFNNSTFCPHRVFMCFVRISEQTAIISLYSIN
jgi:histidinol dehydrogenase